MFGIPLWGKAGIGVLLIAGAFTYGHTRGTRTERAVWELKEAQREASIAAEWLALAKEAEQSARTIYSAIGTARTYIALTQARTKAHVQGVTNAVQQNPDLAGVRQPDDVVRLHAEAVDASAAAADRARRTHDAGSAAVHPAGAGREPDSR